MRLPFFILSAVALVFSSCENKEEGLSTDLINIGPNSSNNRSSDELPLMEFQDSTFNFGTILEGEIIEHTYSFTNVGNGELIISDVNTSCGCTVAKDWSRKPYKPGETGTITVSFDSNKRPGQNNKSIKVLANTVPSLNVITLRGEVIGPK